MTPLTGISSMATGPVLRELAHLYEHQSRQHATLITVGGVEVVRRVKDGEAFDFVVLAADAIEQLAAAGHVDPAGRADLARSGVAIAVASRAPRPDVGSEAALRSAVMNARSIGYSTGPSGVYLARLFEKWGIAESIAARVVQASPGVPVGSLVASGEVELGFQQLSELMHLPGIDVVGLLPAAIQVVTVFSAAICTTAANPGAARALITFLASPQADAAKRRHGMEPA